MIDVEERCSVQDACYGTVYPVWHVLLEVNMARGREALF